MVPTWREVVAWYGVQRGEAAWGEMNEPAWAVGDAVEVRQWWDEAGPEWVPATVTKYSADDNPVAVRWHSSDDVYIFG